MEKAGRTGKRSKLFAAYNKSPSNSLFNAVCFSINRTFMIHGSHDMTIVLRIMLMSENLING